MVIFKQTWIAGHAGLGLLRRIHGDPFGGNNYKLFSLYQNLRKIQSHRGFALYSLYFIVFVVNRNTFDTLRWTNLFNRVCGSHDHWP
jgi:hypothetical protein